VGNLSLFPPHVRTNTYTTSFDDHNHPAFRDHHLDAPCAYRSPAFPHRASGTGLLLNQQNCQ
jgi:hypothetical protein